MTTLLRIDASPRKKDSYSRDLADKIQHHWLLAHPQGKVQRRDLADSPIDHIKNQTIIGYYTPPESLTSDLKQATAESDALIAELQAADALLISTPMYNFSMPSVLKGWIDQVVRVNKTFGFDESGQAQGLVKGKAAYIAASMGAQFSDSPLASMDYLRPYLSALLGFIGFDDVETFSVESTNTDEALCEASMRESISRIKHSFGVQAA